MSAQNEITRSERSWVENMLSLLDRLRHGRRKILKPKDDPNPASFRGYAVCGAPRSGSNYFCEILSSTGLLGRPREYFNGVGRRRYDDPNYPDDPVQQARLILSMGATKNGVYGLKLFPGLFDTVSPHIKITEVLPNLNFVRLRRQDVLGQAISWVRSMQSHQFRSTDESGGQVHFDGEAIRLYVGQVCQRNARWDMFFARTGINPIVITYEDLVVDPQGAVDRVSAVLKVFPRPRVSIEDVKLRIQRDDESQAWRTRFIAEYGDRNSMDSPELLAHTL